MYHLEFCVVLILLLSQCDEVLQTKQTTLEIQILNISIGIIC